MTKFKALEPVDDASEYRTSKRQYPIEGLARNRSEVAVKLLESEPRLQAGERDEHRVRQRPYRRTSGSQIEPLTRRVSIG
jgi:hypothetical protein